MARPVLDDELKRKNRLMIYLTDEEYDAIEELSSRSSRARSQVVTLALSKWLYTLENPPEALKQARHEKIMDAKSEHLRGFTCGNGHAFWIEEVSPMDAVRCPICSSERTLKRTWDGEIERRR